MKKITAHLLSGLAVSVFAFWLWLANHNTPAPSGTARSSLPKESPPGQNRLLNFNPASDDLAVLAAAEWADIKLTADAAMASEQIGGRILTETNGLDTPPICYMRGLLHLGRGQPAEALVAFSKVPVDEIPDPLLYAPWRLQTEIHPDKPNPYSERILSATKAGRLDPLLSARVLAGSAELKAALDQYLKTDPALWSQLDVRIFGLMLSHEGHRGGATALLRAAWKGGRLPEKLRPALDAVLNTVRQAEGAVPPEFEALVRSNPAVQDLFVKAVQHQLSARARFLKGEDLLLIQEYAGSAPSELSNEVVLLLTLCAGRAREETSFLRWSAELARRFPQPDTSKWIASLTPRRP